jgi:hypothetical protein
MGVRIHKTRKHDLAATVDLDDFLAVFLQPGIPESVPGLADRNNLPAEAEHGGVLENAQIAELAPATRDMRSTWGTQSEQLADVNQEQVVLLSSARKCHVSYTLFRLATFFTFSWFALGLQHSRRSRELLAPCDLSG